MFTKLTADVAFHPPASTPRRNVVTSAFGGSIQIPKPQTPMPHLKKYMSSYKPMINPTAESHIMQLAEKKDFVNIRSYATDIGLEKKQGFMISKIGELESKVTRIPRVPGK